MREFYYNMKYSDDGSQNTKVGQNKLHLDVVLFGVILGVAIDGIKSIAGKICFKRFLNKYDKQTNLNGVGILKKFRKRSLSTLF